METTAFSYSVVFGIMIFLIPLVYAVDQAFYIRYKDITHARIDSRIWHASGWILRAIPVIMIGFIWWKNPWLMLTLTGWYGILAWIFFDLVINWVNHNRWDYSGNGTIASIGYKLHMGLKLTMLVLTIVATFIHIFN